MSHLLQKNSSRKYTALLWVVLPVCVIFVILLLVGAKLTSNLQKDKRNELQRLVSGHAELIEHNIHQYVHYLKSVESFVLSELADEHDMPHSHFSSYAENIFEHISAFKTIILSPDGIHKYAYPPEMREKVLGYDLLFDPREEVQNDLTKILESDQSICSGPYPMVNDTGMVFVLRESIFHDKKFWGIASLIIDFQGFIRSTDILTEPEIIYGMRDAKTGHVLSGPRAIWDDNPVRQAIYFADAHWQLAGVPSDGWSDAPNWMLLRFWLSGIIIMALAGLLSYRTYQNRYELNDLVEERTEQLQEALHHQEKLRKEQERTARVLEESEERYRTFVQHISEGVYRIEFSETIPIDLSTEEQIDAMYEYAVLAECNKTFARMLGFADETAVQGKKLEELHSGKCHLDARQRLRSVVESNYRLKDQLSTMVDKDGNTRYYLNSVVGIIKEGHLIRAWGTMRDITDRYLAEQSLQKSQEELSLAIEGADLGLWDWNIQTGAVLFNDRWYGMLGYQQSEIEGHVSFWKKLIHPDDYQETLEILQAHLDGETDYYESVHRLKTKSGEYMWVLDSGKIVEWDETGEPLRAAGIHQDINDMKMAEIALRKSDEQYRQIFENAPIGIFLSTSAGRFLNVNNAAVELLGYNSRGHLLSSVVNLGAQVYADPERRVQFLRKLKRKNEVTNFELKAQKRDGEPIWLSLDAKIQKWENEYEFLIFGFISDKTEQKKVENALQKSEQQYRLLADTAQEMIVMHNLDGTVKYVNPAVKKLTGYSPEEVYQNDITYFLPDNALREIRKRNEIRRSGDSEQLLYTIEIKTKDGTVVPVEASSTPVMEDGDIAGILIVARDISEKMKLQQQLVQAQKMEAIGRLAGGVAHDFNNLLTIINGYSSLIMNSMSDNSKYFEEVKNIHDAGEKAEDLTRQLLAFSRKQEMELAYINLNDVIINIKKMLQRLIGEHITLNTELRENLNPVHGDKGQIEQIIMNLSVNARDAMPDGGNLHIETSLEKLTSKNNPFNFDIRTGIYNRLTVRDSGAGMDKAILQNIFEPFFTTKEAGKGTGLGLATVYGIVKQHDGYITVDSIPGEGSTFHVYFPVANETEEELEELAKPEKDCTGTESILVVEDDETVRQFVTQSLVSSGYKVHEFGRAEPALKIFVQNPQSIDLILTDIVMPEMSGIDMANRIRDVDKNIEILLMSGYADDTLDQFSMESYENFIQKPFTPRQLTERIRYLLDRG